MATLDNARETRRKNLPAAFKAADDPLSVYVEFVEWTARNYGESDPKSGLVPLLEEAISKFRSDSAYKKDLRYLKLWLMLAKTRDLTGRDKIYAECLNNGIGTCFAVLYEDCTEMLEAMGKYVIPHRLLASYSNSSWLPDSNQRSEYIARVSVLVLVLPIG
jgi:checkpoint serine/threonine-protein kinase